MNRKSIVGLLAAWIVSLVGVGLWAQSDVRRVPTVAEGQAIGAVMTGEDIGFQRVAGESQPGKVLGKWMVKVNGKWLETQQVIGIVR